ncbi:MAG: DUF3047 domain-containing protein [Rhodobiaceae bacterium]|nr:DUF3047 domain-containing protein [Rhodobiaceae bacterium]MCC0049850.1 DUF3047 domain-containing protein [Rhodobiaceae bacterium]
MSRNPFSARRAIFAATAAAVMLPFTANAMQTLRYDSGWEAITFRSIPKTRFSLSGDTLRVDADKSASVIYTAVAPGARNARHASWDWTVSASVPPTDLGRKGGDDRNLAIYFVFTDPKTAERLGDNPNIKSLLGKSSSRMLIYVHGGSGQAGSLVPSPYFGGRGTSVIQRPAGTGSHRESVDLASDYERAFASEPGVLVGIAISADSDDTGVQSTATLSPIMLN